MLHGTRVKGPLGTFGVVASERGVRGVAPLAELPRRSGVTWHRRGEAVPAALAVAAHWLEGYFAGAHTPWEGALDAPGTPFQHAVWEALRALPFGATTTYGALAEGLGRPGGARAVAAAVAKNPAALLVPCHRVLAQNGAVMGSARGLSLKHALLAHEGHVPPAPAQRLLFAGLPLLAVAG